MGINLAQFLLKDLWADVRVPAHFAKASQQTNGLDDFFLLQGNDPSSPSTPDTDASTIPSAWPWTASAASSGSATSAHIRHRANGHGDRSRAISVYVLGAFGGGDQLQKFLRLVQPLPKLRSQGLRGNLRGYADLSRRRVRRDEL